MKIVLPDQNFELLFRNLFEKYFCVLKAHARHYTGSISIAEDIVQDAFVQLWELRESFDFERSVKTWLYQAVHNKCINFLKHQQVEGKFREAVFLKIRDAELFDPGNCEEQPDLLVDGELSKRLKASVDALPERCRKTFLLSRQTGLTNREIAKEMNISQKAVERNMTRALTSLREALRDLLIMLLIFRLFI
jgi:RNA polymerase sigma-70 factor (family 1)